MKLGRGAKFIAVASASALSFYASSGLLAQGERCALTLLILAAGLWMTEALPLAATSLLIPLLQSMLGIQGFREALQPFFDPVVMLLLGGFLLAVAVDKHDLDEYIAHQILSRFGGDARLLILLTMLTTALLSMWISNTASTALMLAIALRMTEEVRDSRGNLSKILVLGVAYSATVGGLATLVGTTTTAMAAGMLREMTGYEITFLGWSLLGLPITLTMIPIIWLLLLTLFPTDVKRLPTLEVELEMNPRQRLTLILFASSIVLWATGRLPEPLARLLGWGGHGLSSGAVAALIGFLLFLTGLLDEHDISRVDWGTLLLIGGGLSLGSALKVSGLTARIGRVILSLGGLPTSMTLLLIAFLSLGVSIIASNTASAGILLPIVIGMSGAMGIRASIPAAVVGIATSLDFMLPVGTPPNAIAYSTGKVSLREMIKAGILLDIIGGLLTTLMALILWPHIL